MDIAVNHLWKSYDGTPVLEDFSCSIPRGSCCALLAPSGAGKTTLLRLLLGLEQPDRGEITGVPHRYAAVFQEDRLIPGLSAVSNVTMAAGCSREAAAALLTELGVETDSQTKPTALLSGGQALILDEPFNGLDEGSRQRCAAAIRDYRQGRTLLAVTHNLDDLPLLGIEKRITL